MSTVFTLIMRDLLGKSLNRVFFFRVKPYCVFCNHPTAMKFTSMMLHIYSSKPWNTSFHIFFLSITSAWVSLHSTPSVLNIFWALLILVFAGLVEWTGKKTETRLNATESNQTGPRHITMPMVHLISTLCHMSVAFHTMTSNLFLLS